MKITRLFLLSIALLLSGCKAQKSLVPSMYTEGLQVDKEGKVTLTVDGETYSALPPLGISLSEALPDITATADGLTLAFSSPEKIAGIFYGFLPYDDSKHPLPVYRKFVPLNEAGQAQINIAKLVGKYDMIGWEKKGMGTIGFRVIQTSGMPLFDSKVTFLKNDAGAFQVAPTIVEGPTVNRVHPTDITLTFETKMPEACQVVVSRPRTRAPALRYTESEAVRRHEIVLDNLQPATEYTYTILYGGVADTEQHFSQTYSFKTPPNPGTRAPFVFAYASDSRAGYGGGERDFTGTNAYIMKKMMALLKTYEPAFFQFSGDLINGYSNNADRMRLEYKNWKRAVEPFAHYFPIYVSMGNHEAYVHLFDNGSPYGIQVPHFPVETASAEALFSDEFTLPTNGPESEDGAWYDPNPKAQDFPSYKENVYHYTYDNVAVIVLNSDYLYMPSTSYIRKIGGGMHAYLMDQQIAWLKEKVAALEADANIDHIFVTQHTPCFPNGGHVGDDMWYKGDNSYRPYIAGKPMKEGIIERRDTYLKTLVNDSEKVLAILTGDEHNFALTTISPDMNTYPEIYLGEKLTRKRTIYQVNNGAAGAPYYAQEQTPWSDHVSGFTTQNALVLFFVDGNKVEMVVRNPDTLEDIMRQVLRE